MPRKAKAKKSRAPRGTGSVLPDPRKPGHWLGKVPVGRYPDGRTKYTEVRGRTQAEVIEKKKRVQPPGPATTVAEWAPRWLKESGAQVQSKHDYQKTVEVHIVPAIGSRRITDLTASDIEQMVRGWKTLGPNTARKNLGHVRIMLEAARRARIVSENVAKDARGPKAKKVNIRPFTAPELARIVAEACRSAEDSLFAFLAAVGCRQGEALALDVPDVNPTTGEVSITKTWTLRHGVRRPKSENGVRTVTVPAPALPALRLAVGKRTKGVLFPRGHTRWPHESVRYAWKKFLARLGISYRSCHQLRHSAATHSIAAGIHVANVARDLGDSVATIIRTYVHATSGPGVADAMAKLLTPTL